MATEYDKLKKEITDKVKAAGGSRHSKSDLTLMTQTLLNTPEQEVNVYLKDSTPASTKPVERYRESLKDVVKQFGVDKAELDKVQDITFGKEHAEALMDVATTSMKDYISTGRKMIFPVTSKDESQMEISMVEKEEKTEETRKLVQNEDGSYKSVPTGKKKTTKAHKELKASNKVPSWLKTEQEI